MIRTTDSMPEPNKRTQRTRVEACRAFSLVELLTVVTIILVLMGITLKVSTYARGKAAVAQTVTRLELLKNALAAYYSEFGSYPPTSDAGYTYPTEAASSYPAADDKNWGIVHGLVYYLWGESPKSGMADRTGPPIPEAKRWRALLNGVIPIYEDSLPILGGSQGAGISYYYNTHTWVVKDGWQQYLNYQCVSPYQTYKLWSNGPDGKNDQGTNDDIGVSASW